MAALVGYYIANHRDTNLSKTSFSGLTGHASVKPRSPQRPVPAVNKTSRINVTPLSCWKCGGPHLRKFCNQNKSPEGSVNKMISRSNLPHRVNLVSAEVANGTNGNLS